MTPHIRRIVAAAPATWAIIACVWVLRATHHSVGFFPSRPELLTFLTSGLTAPTWVGAVLATLALVGIGTRAEKRLGTGTFLVAAATLHLVGLMGGSLLAAIHPAFPDEYVLSPLPWLIGTALVASDRLPDLWHRRLRVGAVGLALALVLYDGALVDYALICTTATGLFFSRRGPSLDKPITSIREHRILIAVAATAVFLEPVAAEFNPQALGLFSGGSFFILPAMSAAQADLICELDPGSVGCTHAMWMLRTGGIGPAVANLIPLLLVLIFAWGLSRGRRLAWWGMLATQLVVIAALVKEFMYLQDSDTPAWAGVLLLGLLIAPWLTMTVVLLFQRRPFQVRMVASQRRRFAATMAAWAALLAAAWLLGAAAVRGGFRDASLLDIVRATPLRFLPPVVSKFFTSDVLPVSDAAWFFTEWIGPVFWLGAAWIFYRALKADPDPDASERRADARAILTGGTGDHLSWMTTWAGNKLWFDDDRGFVAYRLHNSVAVTVGEPVSRGADPQDIATRFERAMYAGGAQVAWYSVRPEFAAARGCRAVAVAEESVLDCTAAPEFKGKKFQDVRTARNRAKKENIHSVWTTWADAGATLRNQIIELSEDWVSNKKLPEMGFTLGGLPELDAPEVTLVLALDDAGTLHGVTSWLPVYRDGTLVGLTLDFMRRKTDGFRSVVEYLIAETQVAAHDQGLEWISLSGAPLVSFTEPTTMLEQILARVSSYLEPLYGFKSLAAFKRKFHPQHQQWVLGYRDELALPSIALAVSKAYLPDLHTGDVVSIARSMRNK